MSESRFPCEQCGAQLEFEPGTTSLHCQYCGHVTEIPQQFQEIQELVFEEYLDQGTLKVELETEAVVRCKNCGAEFSLGPTTESDSCPFCGSNVVVTAEPERRIQPGSLLPFYLDRAKCIECYKTWVRSRALAPGDLRRNALAEGGMRGMYVPYWTYDSDTTTQYVGQRGEHYWVTEAYTTIENGRSVTRTRQVRRTRWYPAAGTVFVQFDDVLVLASGAVPPQHAKRMTRWDLDSLVPYEPRFLSGFQAMRYDLDLPSGFEAAKAMMQPRIDGAIRQDIGGDEQMINHKNTHYENNRFKLLLLPIWVGAYRYRGKTYQYLVNARTGEVFGDAPLSWIKITLLVLLVVAILVGAFLLFRSSA